MLLRKLHQLTRQMAIEYAGYGIRVNAVALGTVDTPIVEKSARASGDPKAFWKMLRDNHPIGRVATTEEVACFYTYLASDRRFLHGRHPVHGRWFHRSLNSVKGDLGEFVSRPAGFVCEDTELCPPNDEANQPRRPRRPQATLPGPHHEAARHSRPLCATPSRRPGMRRRALGKAETRG
jgi:hypothetical protein